jgi:hypothetical protein
MGRVREDDIVTAVVALLGGGSVQCYAVVCIGMERREE